MPVRSAGGQLWLPLRVDARPRTELLDGQSPRLGTWVEDVIEAIGQVHQRCGTRAQGVDEHLHVRVIDGERDNGTAAVNMSGP